MRCSPSGSCFGGLGIPDDLARDVLESKPGARGGSWVTQDSGGNCGVGFVKEGGQFEG